MKKTLKFILIICPIILSITLVVNIYRNITYKQNNQNIINDISTIELKIKNNKLNELTNELTTLKEEKKDKIWEYNRWIKWNKEIKEKIN